MEIIAVSKSYGKKTVLRDLSFEAEKGSCIGILGVNGSGKSTLLSVLSGVLPTDSGSFILDGRDLLREKDLRMEKISYVPQGSPLFEELSAYDNLLLWYDRKSLKESLASGVLNRLGIDSFYKTQVRKLSGGMKRRLAIGCAMAKNPKVLLLDEPMAALDIPCREEVGNYLTEFKKSGGIIVMVTHDLQDLSLCDRIYLLKDGTLKSVPFGMALQDIIKEL